MKVNEKAIPKMKATNPKASISKTLRGYKYHIFYALLFILLFVLLFSVFTNNSISMNNYLLLSASMLILGVVHVFLMGKYISPHYSNNIVNASLVTFGLPILGVLVSLIYDNFSHDISIQTLGYMSVLFFTIPYLVMQSYYIYERIPTKVYKPWFYPYGKEVPVVEVIKPIKIRFMLSKDIQDDSYTEFDLNVPVEYTLGDFMHYFIHRYNYDKNPEHPIHISPDNQNQNLYPWIFRLAPGSTKEKEILDPSLTFKQLGMVENQRLFVERYMQYYELVETQEPQELIDLTQEN